MRRLHYHGAATTGRVPRDDHAISQDLVGAEQGADRDCPAHVGHRYGVAAALDLDHGVGAHDPLADTLRGIDPVGAERAQRLPREAVRWSFVRRAMDPLVGHGQGPLPEPGIQLVPRGEAPPGQRIALHVLDPDSVFPLVWGRYGRRAYASVPTA